MRHVSHSTTYTRGSPGISNGVTVGAAPDVASMFIQEAIRYLASSE